MIAKEQIAHDLAVAYINNRYGVEVTGRFSCNGESGTGDVETEHFPDVNEAKRFKVGTGEKGFLGFEKKRWVESGYVVDEVFSNMIEDYQKAYSRFLELLK